MKAVVHREARTFEIESRVAESPARDQVAIEVACTRICGTDPHIHQGDMDGRVGSAAVIGHEICGRVGAVGQKATGWTLGRPVTVMPKRPSFQGIDVPGRTASTSGVAGLTKALADEWAGRGVNVNAIAPGHIATDDTEALRAGPQPNQAIHDRIPAGRRGRADDLAGATVFPAHPASDYVNGIALPVDGGWLGR
ncbi:SDR family oxidoreductase [Streptomyces sp. ALI-76-A]|jgi:NAD(P)-dependent dehydrogenase (short-subunit alcohol dehydrogenase family)|uniref:SDR family oxidoreductase n=1 Tax=Streptomyces sp. ALI-76-A TaxID=3025736 RepID=UPI00256EE5B4|nr:SDR family oxidoreductase [Streptomyces sp. ALI-76-A]MDL5204638.1 SDR family oxidoreductase [Streptomyces sp. ALI-76-A]